MHTFIQIISLLMMKQKTTLAHIFQRFILDMLVSCLFHFLKCHFVALEKTYLTTSKNCQRLLAIFIQTRCVTYLDIKVYFNKRSFYPTND